MITKIKYKDSEHNKKRVGKLANKKQIPDNLARELENFAKRNSIFSTKVDDKLVHHCCPSCLKAHALKKSEELNLDCKEAIEEMFECETGHLGYYLDEEEIIKI